MLDLIPAQAIVRDRSAGLDLARAGLAAAVARRAGLFAEAGLASGRRAVIAHGEGIAFLVDLFAAWRLGASAVIAPSTLTEDERRRVAATTEAALWVGTEPFRGCAFLPPSEITAEGDDAEAAAFETVIDPEAEALVLMTSGTTAAPKGVALSHRALHARIALNLAQMPAAELAQSLCVLPLHFGHGLIGNTLTPLAAGATLTLWREPGIAGLSRLGEAIDAGGITFLSSVPAMWRIVLRASPPPRAGTLCRVHVGSAPLSAELWEAIAGWCGTRRVLNMYGATETTNWIAGHSLEDGAADGCVGRPWGGAIRVIRADGRLAGEGEGEVAVASPSRMTGYLGRPDLTRAACRGAWFLTGDRGRIDAEGRLYLIGRRRHEINRGGIKIPAEEIDLLLERHPAVATACAFALDDPVSGEAVGAAVVPFEAGAIGEAELLAWCESRIRAEARPQRLFIVESLPASERGKLDRAAVRDAVLAATKAGAAP